MVVNIAVVGAGMVGLCTAVNVQQAVPGAKVTLMADRFDLDTTSSGAGGFFKPTGKNIPGVAMDTVKRWCQQSWEFFCGLAQSPEAGETGACLVNGYMLSDDLQEVQNPLYADIVWNFRMLEPEELRRLKFPTKYGNSFITVITQPKKMMPWLMRRFQEQGGIVETRTLQNLEELAGIFDIVMNCTGLGARTLVNDPEVYPVKGQLVKMKAPWMKAAVCFCDATRPVYLIPHDDAVWVGGTLDVGNDSTDTCPKIEEDIVKRATNLLPQLKSGEVVGRWAGLRPQREIVRVEKDLLTVNGKTLRVVHNYGHGSIGITLSWGTSLQAAQLAREWAKEIPRSGRM